MRDEIIINIVRPRCSTKMKKKKKEEILILLSRQFAIFSMYNIKNFKRKILIKKKK